jgi:hypothetical protein
MRSTEMLHRLISLSLVARRWLYAQPKSKLCRLKPVVMASRTAAKPLHAATSADRCFVSAPAIGRGQHHRNKLLECGKGRMQAEEECHQEPR